LGYADDQSFAQNWLRSRVESRQYGPRRIAQELRARGIAGRLTEELIADAFSGRRENSQARALLHKRFGSHRLQDQKTLRRAAAFLQRQGYSETVIREVLGLSED
jgi:regulatory protein